MWHGRIGRLRCRFPDNRTERRITNHLLGGDLVLEWNVSNQHVMMTGPATEVFTGSWNP